MTQYEIRYYNDMHNIAKEISKERRPDWEKRRYEIVKDLAVAYMAHPDREVSDDFSRHREFFIEGMISFANEVIDALIEENLKHPLK